MIRTFNIRSTLLANFWLYSIVLLPIGTVLLYNRSLGVIHLAYQISYPLTSTFPFLPYSSYWQSPFYSLPLWIWWLWVPPVSGLRQHYCLISVSIMTSGFTRVVVCVIISFFFKSECIPLFVDNTFCCKRTVQWRSLHSVNIFLCGFCSQFCFLPWGWASVSGFTKSEVRVVLRPLATAAKLPSGNIVPVCPWCYSEASPLLWSFLALVLSAGLSWSSSIHQWWERRAWWGLASQKCQIVIWVLSREAGSEVKVCFRRRPPCLGPAGTPGSLTLPGNRQVPWALDQDRPWAGATPVQALIWEDPWGYWVRDT